MEKRMTTQQYLAESYVKTIFYSLKNEDVVVKMKEGKPISGRLDEFHPAHGNIILKDVDGIKDKMVVIRDDWVMITGVKKHRR